MGEFIKYYDDKLYSICKQEVLRRYPKAASLLGQSIRQNDSAIALESTSPSGSESGCLLRYLQESQVFTLHKLTVPWSSGSRREHQGYVSKGASCSDSDDDKPLLP